MGVGVVMISPSFQRLLCLLDLSYLNAAVNHCGTGPPVVGVGFCGTIFMVCSNRDRRYAWVPPFRCLGRVFRLGFRVGFLDFLHTDFLQPAAQRSHNRQQYV